MKVPKIAVAADPLSEDSFAGLCECGYSTRGWPNPEIAGERIFQHQDEHKSGIEHPNDPSNHRLMEPLESFRARHGLVQSPIDGGRAIFPEDAVLLGDDAEEISFAEEAEEAAEEADSGEDT